jgi:hypothetical protein
MSIASIVIAVIGLFVSARTKVNAVVFGQHLSIPVLWLMAAIIILALLAAVLWLARLLAAEGLRQRPAWAAA